MATAPDAPPAEPAVPLTLTGKNADTIREKLLNIEEPLVILQERQFKFRKVKEIIEVPDPANPGETKKETKESKRAPVTLVLPLPTFPGVVSGLYEPKQLAYILDLLADQVMAAAREQIDDEDKPVNNQEDLDLRKLTLEYLANLPKAERTGGGISDTQWTGWAADYISVMPGITGKPLKPAIESSCELFTKKMAPVKGRKDVLGKLKSYINIYITKAPNAGDFTDVCDYIDRRLDTMLAAEDPDAWGAL